jgi:hypothetical protein
MASDLAPADGARSSWGSALEKRKGSSASEYQKNEERSNSRSATTFLDIILTSLDFTPRHHDDALVVERGDDVLPVRHLLDAGPVLLLGAIKHVVLYDLKESGNIRANVGEGKGLLVAVIASNGEGLLFLEVVWSYL